MLVPGDRLADRYRIVGVLGSGGMATVHRAVDERLERDVALKILLPNHAADPAMARRFEREARAMAAVAHPGVVAVFDVDPGDPAAGREPFFVMELCPGGSLATRLVDGRRLTPDELVPILVSVADGLDGLHRARLVHRDIKPSNILFATDRAKVGDLGLAQTELDAGPAAITAPGTAIGTLAYLAPEVLRGARAGPAADVFALATVAFLGLTGQVPRPAASMADLLRAVGRPPPLVSAVAPDLGTAFDAALAAALSTMASDRPDAIAFGSALTAGFGRWVRSGRPGTVDGGSVAMGQAPRTGPVEDRSMADATTAKAMSLAPTAPIGVTGNRARGIAGPDAGPDEQRRAPTTAPVRQRTSPGPATWLPIAAAVVLIGLAAAILPGLLAPGGTGPSPTSPRPSRAAASTASPSLSPSPALASPSPSPVPSPTIDPALAALAAVDAAISRARGGPDGLKGKEANELESLAAKVRRDLDAGDRAAALADAGTLDDRVRKATERIGVEDRDRLRAASADLAGALGG